MSFLAKLWSSSRLQHQRRDSVATAAAAAAVVVGTESIGKRIGEKEHQQHEVESNNELQRNGDRKCLKFGVDPVRILLFRDCETRVNRILLYDSMAAEGCERCSVDKENKPVCRTGDDGIIFGDGRSSPKISRPSCEPVVCEHEKLLVDDTRMLCAMTFGSVAMTYKGPSFKIHVVDSPASIVCAKVFPFSEHSVCRPGQRHSSETFNTATNLDSNSSNSSLRTTIGSRHGSGNVSGNSLSPNLRKNSTCSSVGSGWDIEVPRLGSSQSLDGNGSSSGLHGSGSLTSLRQRWRRAVSASLGRSESDDAFSSNGSSSSEGLFLADGSNAGKHRTRLGLVLLLHLPAGREREMTTVLLNHAPLLEGMLERLRYSCGKGPRHNLVYRLYRASRSSTLRLLQRLMRLESETTKPLLLWHNVLLHSTRSFDDVSVSLVHRSLQQMCWLLEKYDTKSTNFFISTIVTAVLTHHLGWVHTAPPCRDRQMVEKIGKQFGCNPLWAQLVDLYGALGTPTRVAHTVIAGDPDKASLIESVLHFLSYFIRSGVVDEERSTRCPDQEDFREAKAALERALRRNPSLKKPPQAGSKRSLKQNNGLKSTVPSSSIATINTNTNTLKHFEVDSQEQDEAASKKLKRSGTMLGRLNEFTCAQEPAAPLSGTSEHEQQQQQQQQEEEDSSDRQATSKVKIIVSDEDECDDKLFGINKLFKQTSHNQQLPLLLTNKAEITESPSSPSLSDDPKLPFAVVDRHKLPTALASHPANSKTLDEQLAFAASRFVDDEPRPEQVKTQVYFTLGDEKPTSGHHSSIHDRLTKSPYHCQCSYAFTRVPSTSAELPDGILRKIIQRNFPESSKNMRPPRGEDDQADFGMCLKCRRGYRPGRSSFENGKLLETPTNATEVLRGCSMPGPSTSGLQDSCARSSRVIPKVEDEENDVEEEEEEEDSLEALLEANGIVQLPMPRTKKAPSGTKVRTSELSSGFHKSLIGLKVESASPETPESGYTWGMVMQGLTKRKRPPRREQQQQQHRQEQPKKEEEWWWPIRENLGFSAKFPIIDQPVSEALCIIGDLDSWQVGLLSNASNALTPISVGMSRLVSNMLEAFVCMWKTFHSPEICVKFLESRLREMWMRSRSLAEFLLTAELDDASVRSLTEFLDVDVADLPLLVAVASTHTPQISQRFGLTLA